MSKPFDYIVIGGGSGGITSAYYARKYNKSVAVIEGGKIGGTCVNVGCVPKKIMWSASSLIEDLQISSSYGLSVQYTHNWQKLRTAREAYITNINNSYDQFFIDEKIEYFRGWAKFVDSHTVEVSGNTLTAPHILIATGSETMILDIPGKELLKTSDDFFALEHAPAKVLVVGNGYIAAELAGIFKGFGVDTAMALRTNQFLSIFDHEAANVVRGAMETAGVRFLTNRQLAEVRQVDGGVLARFNNGEEEVFEEIYCAIGRTGNIKHLALENTGLSVVNGFVPSDDFENTNVEGIYSLGDVSGKVQLTPVAIAAGKKLVDRIFGLIPDSKLDYENIPTVMFTHPPFGMIGLSEEQAKKANIDYKVYRTQFNSMFYGLTDHKVPTFMKLIVVGPEEKIIGLHAVGRGVDEMIQGFAVAIKMGATKKDFDRTVAIHPTSSEELVTLT